MQEQQETEAGAINLCKCSNITPFLVQVRVYTEIRSRGCILLTSLCVVLMLINMGWRLYNRKKGGSTSKETQMQQDIIAMQLINNKLLIITIFTINIVEYFKFNNGVCQEEGGCTLLSYIRLHYCDSSSQFRLLHHSLWLKPR